MTVPGLHASSFDAWCSHLVYETTALCTGAGLTLGWGLRTQGGRNIPMTGPALVVANHQSFLDPILIGLATRRHLCFLARKTLFRHFGLSWLIRMLNAVPIDQEGVAKEGLRIVLRELEHGQAVVMFPEGHRTRTGAMQPLLPGISLLIKRSLAPIVPVGIAGAFEAWPTGQPCPKPAPLFLPAARGSIAVSVGKPLDARRLATMTREQSLNELHQAIEVETQRAERVRRKPRDVAYSPIWKSSRSA
jgi:1-acyl-sn-glycerol-3-phosphate acyltransferase